MNAEPNDPTRSGSPLPPDSAARLSQSEIESLCLKAARGAGMSWGMAEEASRAAASLAAWGIDGPDALLVRLQAKGALSSPDIRSLNEVRAWRAMDDGILCPIALGVTLCDFAALPRGAMADAPLPVGPVAHALLLLPFLADVAETLGGVVALRWQAGEVAVASAGPPSGDVAALQRAAAIEAQLSLRPSGARRDVSAPERLACTAGTLRGLNTLAMRTTVPSSETSRSGAGAMTSDND